MQKLIAIFFAVTLMLPVYATGQTISQVNISAFKKMKEISVDIPIPTIVETTYNFTEFSSRTFFVEEVGSDKIVQQKIEHTTITDSSKLKLTNTPSNVTNSHVLFDGLSDKVAKFTIPTIGDVAEATLIAEATEAIQSNGLMIQLADNSSRPTHISIVGDDQVVVNKKVFQSSHIQFPITTAKQWEITLHYIQPLAITEIQLSPVGNTKRASVMWLAIPGKTYRVYSDPDTNITLPNIETGQMQATNANMQVNAGIIDNPQYVPSDDDQDGVANDIDNCRLPNPDQEDQNNNDLGDACEDTDADGIINGIDNCPLHANRVQKDVDGDGIGDICDDDESRITEKYPWLPWAGMSLTAIVLLAMFAHTLILDKKMNKK